MIVIYPPRHFTNHFSVPRCFCIPTLSVPTLAVCQHTQPRRMAVLSELYGKVEHIVREIEASYKIVKDLDGCPGYIKNSPCWYSLRDSIDTAWVLCASQGVDVLLLQLKTADPSCDTKVVIKAITAEHARKTKAQINAEIQMAKLFSWHPLMATILKCHEDEEGNVVMVSPYAGVCMADIVGHPHWFGLLTEAERTQLYAALQAHSMEVLALMQEADCDGGYYYRDTKPENLAYDWRSRQFKVFDFGLAMHCSGSDYHPGITPGYLTPEMCWPGEDNLFRYFLDPSSQFFVYNSTTDVYLHGLLGLELITGLPDHLKPETFDISTEQGMVHMLQTHNTTDFAALVRRINSSTARYYLSSSLHTDVGWRQTPADALEHPFLLAAAAEMRTHVAETLPAYIQQAISVVSLLESLPQDKPAVFVATEQQQYWMQQYREQQQSDTESVTAPATPSHGNSNGNLIGLPGNSCNSSSSGSDDCSSISYYDSSDAGSTSSPYRLSAAAALSSGDAVISNAVNSSTSYRSDGGSNTQGPQCPALAQTPLDEVVKQAVHHTADTSSRDDSSSVYGAGSGVISSCDPSRSCQSNGSASRTASINVTIAAADGIDVVNAVVTIKSTTSHKRSWMGKGLQWFGKFKGSSSRRKVVKEVSGSDAADMSTPAARIAAVVQRVQSQQAPATDNDDDGDGNKTQFHKVKVPGLCGLRLDFGFKRHKLK